MELISLQIDTFFRFFSEVAYNSNLKKSLLSDHYYVH